MCNPQITDRILINETLHFMSQLGWKETRSEFFNALVSFLGQKLEVEYVLVDELLPDGVTAKTIGVYAEGEIIPDIEYSLQGTPCENVMGKRLCSYPRNIQKLFPKDDMLIDLGAESYVGIPLFSTTGEAIGLVAIMGKAALVNRDDAELVLQLVATRCAHEIQQKRNEQEVADSQKQLRQLFDEAACGIVLADPATDFITDCNSAFADLLRRDKNEIIGERLSGFHAVKTQFEAVAKDFNQDLGGMSGEPSENEIVTGSGETIAVEIRANLIALGGKQFVQAFFTDISERKHAVAALRDERFRLNEIVRGTNVGTWEWNVQTGETIFNPRWAEIIGYTLAELAPISIDTWEKHSHPDDFKASEAALKWHFSGELNHYEHECRMKHKDGHWVWVVDRGKVSTWTPEGNPLLMFGTHTDVTTQKLTGLENQKNDKLNSIGTLAGGIAHDFNNILAGIYGNISLAKTKITKIMPGHLALHNLDAAESSMGRATALTSQLLTFSTGGAPMTETLCLGQLVNEVVPRHLASGNVKTDISQSKDLWLSLIDRRQMQQVFENLVANAKHAMPEGGLLNIQLENAEVENSNVKGLTSEKYIKVKLTDNGSGIKPEHLEQIFDPYFTTNFAGNGLGLSTVYSIIKKHHGHIKVESQIGQGTTFTLHLPATEAQKKPTLEATNRHQGASILVMDDEDIICDILRELLEYAGYKVVTVANGQLALEQYYQALKGGTPFDLVILDLTIPNGMGGKEVVKHLLALHSEAKVIVSSGHADDPVMANYADHGFKGVAVKPYELNTLLDIVTEALMR